MPIFVALIAIAIVILAQRRFPTISRILLILSFLFLFIFSLPITSIFLLGLLESRYASTAAKDTSTADAIVLLSGGVSPPTPPRKHAELSVASDRLLLSFRLWNAKKANVIIITGGFSSDLDAIKSEAAYTAEILQLWGVPESDIILEEKSKNTAQHVENLDTIFSRHEISSILLVTSALHMPRAVKLFEKSNTTIIPAPSNRWIVDNESGFKNDLIPSAVSLYGSSTAIRELLGLAYYSFKD